MILNQFFNKFKHILKAAFVLRLVLALVFVSIHPSMAFAAEKALEASRPVVVAIIDEGVDFSHPALKDRLWTNLNEIPADGLDNDMNGFVDDVYAWNFFDNDNKLSPKGGHGTKLAGLIPAEIKIMPLIACKQNFGCDQTAIINSIFYAVNNGANVINLSLGDTSGYKTAYNEAIKFAYEKNVVIVASAGSNDYGLDLSKKPISPICNDNGKNMVLGVGTVDQKNQRPKWANFGSCIDVSAQGTNLYTTLSPNYSRGDQYGYVEGNSYSTATVSGVVALLVSQNPQITSAEVIFHIHNNSIGKNLVLNTEKTLANKVVTKPQVLGASVKVKPIPIALKPKLVIR